MKLNVRKQPNVTGTFLKVISYSLFVWFGYIFLENSISVSDEFNFSYGPELIIILIALLVCWGAVTTFRNYRIKNQLSSRQEQLMLNAARLEMEPATLKLSKSLNLIADNKLKYRNHRVTNSYLAYDWGYGEYQFSSFRKSKNGTYDTATYHFAIGIFVLPRKLPNVFFDSHRTGGNEFKLLFDASQKHSLESVFDNYFTTYFHEDYTIDNLSFITPEVMEALIFAQEYDIEIYEDKLYIYNELENMPAQLEDIQRVGALVRDKLLNNVTSYRDQRIDFKNGRKTVSMLGHSLKLSLSWTYVKLAFSMVLLLSLVGMGIVVGGDILVQGYIFALIIVASYIFRNYSKIRKVKKEQTIALQQISIGA